MIPEIEIAGRRIGPDRPPFIVAELSGNHDGSLERALRIVDAIAEAGADAVKLQTYTADMLTIDSRREDFLIRDSGTPWEGRNLYELYEQAHTPMDWHAALFERAREHGLICFSSPFEPEAVDFLEGLDCPAYKIASFENNHLELIRHAAATGKPVLISSGLSDVATLDEAVAAVHAAGGDSPLLFKCTSSYPGDPRDSHLRTVPHMRDLFGCQVGLSDHTPGIGVPVAAVAHGAVAIEKHVTLDRAAGGVDAAFSLEPAELAALVTETRRAWEAGGGVRYEPTDAEAGARRFKRSLYVVRDLRRGDTLTRENLRVIRPGYGLAPRHLDAVLGMSVNADIERGTPLSWDLLRPDT
ncbi:pseudaminic acid synthase [Salinisphaera sp. PC39]|uniref:pseudaminic acid synthase n=1 Tax=Salinisphaera sp. PC39 TaxID=1304156 RepID=UPI0033407835